MVNARTQDSVLDAPLYSPAEAARYLGLPAATVRSWVVGRDYDTAAGTRRFDPIVNPPDESGRLSFRNLVELQVLRALRVRHGVRLETIRSAIFFMSKRFGVDHPLADERMRTDGKELFADFVDALVRLDDGQMSFGEILRDHIGRIEWEGDQPVRLFPFPAQGGAASRAVVLDPRVRWGQPVLAGTGIPVAELHERRESGESLKSIAGDYGRSVSEIKVALRFAA